MKILKLHFSVCVILVTLFLTFDAVAASIKRANTEDIKFLLNAAGSMNSAYWASYIGETNGRIYIEYKTLVHSSSFFSKEPKHVVYWLPTSELSKEDLDKFKEFKASRKIKKGNVKNIIQFKDTLNIQK